MRREIDKLEEFANFAQRLADVAAKVTLTHYRQPHKIDNKDTKGFDPVTQADKAAEKAIRQLIAQTYPDHAITGEEWPNKTTASPYEWVLDPIDGTRAYISGVPCWGTLIALAYEGEPILGVIDQPYIGERYVGYADKAFLNNQPIRCRACPKLSTATLTTTDPALFRTEEMPLFNSLKDRVRLIRYGLDCYGYAVLSAGFMDMVIESGLARHDRMALIPLIRGAGGIVTDWAGNDPAISDRIIAAGDPSIHQEALELISVHIQKM